MRAIIERNEIGYRKIGIFIIDFVSLPNWPNNHAWSFNKLSSIILMCFHFKTCESFYVKKHGKIGSLKLKVISILSN